MFLHLGCMNRRQAAKYSVLPLGGYTNSSETWLLRNPRSLKSNLAENSCVKTRLAVSEFGGGEGLYNEVTRPEMTRLYRVSEAQAICP